MTLVVGPNANKSSHSNRFNGLASTNMLKRVSIQNFKSLKKVGLNLQKVNLLIGPNNSGKTNFLKALEYMLRANSYNREPDHRHFSFNRNSKEVSIQFEFSQDSNRLINEIFECKIPERSDIVRTNWIEQDHLPSASMTFDPNELKTKAGKIIIYKPDPNKLDKPGPVGLGEDIVNADASNLVGFLDLMLSRYRKTIFNQIEIDLRKCIPEFSEINLDDAVPTDGLIKQYGDKSFKRIGLTNSKQGTSYWADELSEGTLYFLALLCIIHQPNPPKLLLLEEPEKGIHPRRIWEVMKFIFQLAEEKDVQIILTSHNEHVVNAFSSMPEAVFVFDKDEEGATIVKNLLTEIIEPSHKKSEELGLDKIDFTENLGENWLYGLLGGVPTDND